MLDSKRCGTCKEYDKKKRVCKITKKPVMKIAEGCSKHKEK